MPERARRRSGTEIYHVIVKGINKERIYEQSREKEHFKQTILEYQKKYQVQIYAYCIMSNHAHIMIRAQLEELSLFMARILAEYAVYYNYKHYRNGHVFQNRFTSECIETEPYFLNCMRYIHMNPVKAHMVKKAVEYPYSSMKEFYLGKAEMIDVEMRGKVQDYFRDWKAFEEFHNSRGYEIFTDIKDEMEQQYIEMAVKIAGDFFRKYALENQKQVFEEKHIRKEYIKCIQRTLNISGNKAKTIYDIVRKQIDS